MKKLIIIGFCIITVASVTIYGCKKGPEDPSISFRSRRARVSGTWTVSAFTVNGIDSLTQIPIAIPDSSAGPCGTLIYSVSTGYGFTWVFDKTGSYDITTTLTTTASRTFTIPNPKNKCVNASASLTGIPTESKGLWDFAGGVGAFNSKEQIILTDPTDHVNGRLYDLIKCSYKELILHQSVTTTDTTTKITTVKDYIWTLDRKKT